MILSGGPLAFLFVAAGRRPVFLEKLGDSGADAGVHLDAVSRSTWLSYRRQSKLRDGFV